MASNGSAAIILAGGRSRRMGQDKALIILEGQTLLQRLVNRIAPVFPQVVVVADSSDRYELPNARVICDLFPGAGPVGGIITGLRHIGQGAHFILACDMPGVDIELVRLLMDLSRPSDDAVAFELHGRLEPLCAIYRDSAEPKLSRFLAEGGRSARAALDLLSTRRIEEVALRRLDPTAQSLTNLNTPDDLHRFIQDTQG